MAYTNETTHFSIPLPLGSDLTTPMDYNTAAAAVDAALFEAQTNASQAASDASNAVDTANQAASDVGDLGGDLNTLTGRVTALEQSDVIQDNKIGNLEIKVPTKFDSVGIADAYVNGLTYAVGDIVTYNGQRYVCNTAVTAAEPFDADKWTAKDIQTELDQINTNLSSKYAIQFVTVSGTTDASGFYAISSDVVKPSTDYVIGAIDAETGSYNKLIFLNINQPSDAYRLVLKNISNMNALPTTNFVIKLVKAIPIK